MHVSTRDYYFHTLRAHMFYSIKSSGPGKRTSDDFLGFFGRLQSARPQKTTIKDERSHRQLLYLLGSVHE